MTITELIAAAGCTPVADLTHEQRIALLRLARVEFECYTEGDLMNAPVLLGMRTRYPVAIEDRPGGGYLVAQKKPPTAYWLP